MDDDIDLESGNNVAPTQHKSGERGRLSYNSHTLEMHNTICYSIRSHSPLFVKYTNKIQGLLLYSQTARPPIMNRSSYPMLLPVNSVSVSNSLNLIKIFSFEDTYTTCWYFMQAGAVHKPWSLPKLLQLSSLVHSQRDSSMRIDQDKNNYLGCKR